MVNVFKRLNNIKLTRYIDELMQEAVRDQFAIYTEEPNDYNLGWLQAFEEAKGRAKLECEIAKGGGFITETWDKEYYLWEILIQELNTNQDFTESNVAILKGRIASFQNWIGWDLEPPKPKKKFRIWL